MRIYLSKKDIEKITSGATRIEKGDITIIIDEKGIRGEWIDQATGKNKGKVEIMNEFVSPWKERKS